jgi:hypothetical protein
MARGENMPWGWLLLGILGDSRGTATLQQIYARIERDSAESGKTDPKIILPRLFTKNLRYGDRPIFQHTVRGCLTAYKKKSLIERIDRGVYRITDAGRNRLEWYNKCY